MPMGRADALSSFGGKTSDYAIASENRYWMVKNE